MIKYQTYDPRTGEISRFDSEQEAMDSFMKMVVDTALRYATGCPYTKVEILEDGAERYFSDTNVAMEDWITTPYVQKLMNDIRNGN